MPIRNYLTDTVSLIKLNGDRQDGIPASVQQRVIIIEDASLIIESGDHIERVASNGLRELFEVTDPGFNEAFGSFKAHYQIRFKRIDTRSRSTPRDRSEGTSEAPIEATEKFFPAQSDHDAYTRLRSILQEAQHSVTIVDPYVDTTLLKLLATCPRPLEIRILTSRPPSDFDLEVTKFMAQHAPSTVEVRSSKDFHDRFIVLDGQRCVHVGASIKDAGLRAFMISEVEDATNLEVLLGAVNRSWTAAAP